MSSLNFIGRSAAIWRSIIWGGLILVSVAISLLSGGLRPVDDALSAIRFSAVQRPASQSLTIVEIDSRSLKAGASWPWDRTRYAEAIDKLVDAGAVLVAFDVDFSTVSGSTGDAALAEAISRHPGQVALATFNQNASYGGVDRNVVGNAPLAHLSRDAMLASVNVPVDADGKVRRYERSNASGVRSVAAFLAGAPAEGSDFLIDFGIKPRTIGQISFEDVLTNSFDPALVRGRVVLIGATALELGDEFATPKGLLPGVVIHGLAYESLSSGRALMSLGPLVLLMLCLLLGLALLPVRQGGPGLKALIIRHVISGLGILVLPILVQATMPVSLQFAPLLLTQIVFAVWATRVELARRARAVIEEREAGLLHLAMHQSETGLPNRRALLTAIDAARLELPGVEISIVTIGVERHAEMRGVVGYGVANELMGQLAQRMAELVDASCVAHVATSVLAFHRCGIGPEGLHELLSKLADLETNFQVESHSIDIFLRVGAAIDIEGGSSPEALLERATLALNKAQRTDQRVLVHDPAVFGSPRNNLALMTEMREGISAGDVMLHYQPKMTAADGSIRSVEALCRWRHPERGFVSPDEFIPIAEETGQIRTLTEWTVMQAVKDQARLREAGYDITVAINVSGRLLSDPEFLTHALEITGAVETRLCFEITETAVIESPATATDAIAAYRAAGIKISIDDYGSGLSSLGYLKMLNADELKIDKSLVVDVMTSARDRLIMKSTIDLAHSLGMAVVAEGVETEELTAALRLMGCDTIQGWHVSKALPVMTLMDFLGTRSSTAQTTRRQDPRLVAALP